ncbi:hypothetical protein CEXT_119571 [Caerostris extrusa]|uniref:Uncharacterized protein n=1 Tax=Caerostris extrusa TaxID=172846 RepID=A0AAV4VUB2_CAEEX|nr:hypothetical protein CEXT_119571 [Caerostris extrusa]
MRGSGESILPTSNYQCVSNIYLPFKQINGLTLQPPFPFEIANCIKSRDVPAQTIPTPTVPKINYLWNTFPNHSSPVMRAPPPPPSADPPREPNWVRWTGMIPMGENICFGSCAEASV